MAMPADLLKPRPQSLRVPPDMNRTWVGVLTYGVKAEKQKMRDEEVPIERAGLKVAINGGTGKKKMMLKDKRGLQCPDEHVMFLDAWRDKGIRIAEGIRLRDIRASEVQRMYTQYKEEMSA